MLAMEIKLPVLSSDYTTIVSHLAQSWCDLTLATGDGMARRYTAGHQDTLPDLGERV